MAMREADRDEKREDCPSRPEPTGPTRRAFLVGAGALAVGVAAGVACRPFAAQADVLRPPGSAEEADFMALCIRCERCISVCPEDVLEPVGIEGGLAVRTPRLTYASGSCTFCDKCREVCPTQAVGHVDPHRPDLGRIGVAVLHTDRCLAFVRDGSCSVCVDACPYGALSLDERRHPAVDVDKCNGCGECVRICPANSLTSFAGGSVRGIEVVTERKFAMRGGAA